MSPRDGNRRRVLSYEERVLWTTVTQSIAPLREPPAAIAEHDAAAIAPPRAPARAARPAPIAAPAPQKPAPPPKPASPMPAPLGRRMKQRVARGKEGIDARLDLHGLTQAEAHSALLRFLRTAHARDARLVLVITGKGGRGELHGERGVLKRQVPHWLALPEFRDLVIGFEDAHLTHGGEGALYVRVRRSRG
ncbi:MAG TPA: Smr/MutS family protein [Pseudolabrys sp.]